MIVGIDLGTTYCVCAYVDNNKDPQVIENAEGDTLTPSVVEIEDDGNVIVGELAKSHAITDAKNVISAVKNYMGTKKIFDQFTCGQKHTPETISALILKKLVEDCTQKLGFDISQAVITVPAYFTDAQREATSHAAQLAGIHMTGSINEPTAAALCFAQENHIEKANIIVYDLGGGTFDVTVLSIDKNLIEVKASDGIAHAGGRFFDEEIVNYACEYLQQKYGIDLFSDTYRDELQDLYNKAEQCKIQLGARKKSDISIRMDGIKENITITREFLESRIEVFYKRSERRMKQALKNADMDIDDIDELLLVGGSTKIPYIQKRLKEFYGKEPSRQLHPDEAVAKGAAIYANFLEQSIADIDDDEDVLEFTDVCSHSIGIVTVDSARRRKINSILIKKNTPLPADVSTNLKTVGSDNRGITITLTEGEFEELDDVTMLCDFKLELPREIDAGTDIQMQLHLDEFQMMHIFLHVPELQLHREYQFDRIHNLTKDELNELSGLVSGGAEEIEKFNSSGQNSKLLSQFEKNSKKSRHKYMHDESINIEEAFEHICGMQEIREELGNLHRLLQLEEERKEFDIESSMLTSTHFTIAGAKSTGKTMLAETIHKILYAYGIRGNETADFIEGRDLASAFPQLMQLEDRTIIIENIEKCANHDGLYDKDSILWPLQKLLSRKKQALSVIITGSDEGIRALLAQEPELSQDLYQSFFIPPYTADELMDICILMAEKRKLLIDDSAKGYIRTLLKRNYRKTGFTNASYISQMLEDASFHMADRISANGYKKDIEIVTLVYEDFLTDDDTEADIKSVLAELDKLIGLQSVKQMVLHKIEEANFNIKQEEAGLGWGKNASRHLIFYGNPGTGKTTVARMLGRIYYSLGMLPEDKLVECTAGDLVAGYVGQTAVRTRAKINKAVGGVLFIDEAYMLSDDKSQFNAEAIAEILTQMENHKDDLMVIMAGYQDEMEHFFHNTNEGLLGRFPAQNRIVFEDYTMEELKEIFCSYVTENGYALEDGCEALLLPMLEQKSKEDGFHNARGVRNTFEHVIENLKTRVAPMEHKTKEDYRLIRKTDIEKLLTEQPKEQKNKEELLAELDSMVGLASVKKEMRRIIKSIEANLFFAKQGGRTDPVRVSNMLFLGNPGTGKTTVARIFCEILEELDILKKKGHFIEADREKLVSKFVGETAEKTRKLVEQAYGGVLFIDEAYSLVKDAQDSYGREAVATLLKLMEDHRDELIVIAAGYTNEMQDFLDSNSGLASRFPTTLTFTDYTSDELYQILETNAKKQGCSIDKDCAEPIKLYFEEMRFQKNFGNARVVRNLFEKMYDAMKIRIFEQMQRSTLEEKPTFVITFEDFLEVTS